MKEAEAGERLLAYADPSPSAFTNRELTAFDNPAAAIISPHFCSSHSMDLAIVRKVLTIREGNFVVTDITGNMIFKVRGSLLFSLHDRRVLLDTAGYPIITLRKKLTSAHDRWQVYRGDSKETRDLIFSAKKSSVVQFKTTLDVFLAHNITEDAPDFKVKGSWHEQSCFIYGGNSSTIVAQMHKKHTVKSVLFGKDNFVVTVYPGIDQAFIVALIVILDEINWSADFGSKLRTDQNELENEPYILRKLRMSIFWSILRIVNSIYVENVMAFLTLKGFQDAVQFVTALKAINPIKLASKNKPADISSNIR